MIGGAGFLPSTVARSKAVFQNQISTIGFNSFKLMHLPSLVHWFLQAGSLIVFEIMFGLVIFFLR